MQTIKLIKNGNLKTVFLPEECDIGSLEFCGSVLSKKPEAKDDERGTGKREREKRSEKRV